MHPAGDLGWFAAEVEPTAPHCTANNVEYERNLTVIPGLIRDSKTWATPTPGLIFDTSIVK